ncbi:MAG: hypothetical protein PVSMB4_11310 [Ktedonobacterales bacterium]
MYNRYESPTTLGIPERWERVLCYAFGWLSGLVLLIVEQRNHNVRRHAAQSVMVFGALSILAFVVATLGGWLGGIWAIGGAFALVFWLVGRVIGLLTLGAWVGLMLLAYFQPHFVLPFGRTYERLLG